MPTPPSAISATFRSWLNGRPADEPLLTSYIGSIGAEWWTSEWKACEEQVGYGVRKTVAAMANGTGGEFFVGVKDDKSMPGTSASVQQLEQELGQPLAQPGIWYLVDLLQPVRHVTAVALEGTASGRRAFILEVVPVALPALVREDDGTLALYLRSGGSSTKASGFRALEWNRVATRERLLLTIFREFDTMVHQVRIAVGYDIRVTAGISPRLPYLVRSLEDGTFYNLLTNRDIEAILGRRTPDLTSNTPGFLSRFLELEDRVWQIRERQARYVAPHLVDDRAIGELSNEHRMLEQGVTEFRRWLVGERVLVEPPA
jgi:hypothetical protein